MKFFSACKDSKLAQKIQADRGIYSHSSVSIKDDTR